MTDGSRVSAGMRIEWPTLALIAGVYLLFGLLTWFHAALPWWLLLLGGAYVTGLHGSLQHEATHGHPTPWAWLNEALIFPSLWLWMPFRIYRESHLVHHRDAALTDPLEDPESYYVTPQVWARLGAPARAFFWAHNSVAGRLLLGPPGALWRLLAASWRPLLRGEPRHLLAWALHLAGAGLVLAWVVGLCGMPLWLYLLTFAYPGLSLTLLRSFLEHQARPAVGTRSVLVEAGPAMALLFLNNNLHALHHAEPGLPWYRLPARYRAQHDLLLADNGGYRYRGYLEVIARHLLWPKEPPVHPLMDRAIVVTATEAVEQRPLGPVSPA